MDFRYLLPASSNAKVYFSMDDDVSISCKEMTKSFKIWQERSVGDIGPIVTYGPRGFDFIAKSSEYRYSDPEDAQLFSLALVGIAWIPRFYLELYNTDMNLQIHQMREIVREKNNCDDIALNFIVSYFFPEFVPVAIEGDMRMNSPLSSQSNSKNHYIYRSECLYRFTHIFGFNPLRIIVK